MRNNLTMKRINDKKLLLEKLKNWLGYDGLSFFCMCLEEYGTISPVFINKIKCKRNTFVMPHSVHFNEGMSVRNFMRSTNLCLDWNDHDYDNHWSKLVEEAIKTCGFKSSKLKRSIIKTLRFKPRT